MTRSVPQSATAPTTRPRLLYLDNLRTALTARVVVHHAAVSYTTIAPGWYYVEPATGSSKLFLELLLVLNQTFGMAGLFLIAGLFVPHSYDRKGAGRYFSDRLLRLGVPLVAWLLVLLPLANIGRYLEARDAAAAQGGDLPYWQFTLETIRPGPMWFVWVLLVFSAAYVLWRRLSAGGRHASRPVTGRAPGAAAIVGFALGLALVTYLWRIAVPMDASLPVIPTPGYLPQYAAMFTVGVIAARRGWLAGLPRAAGRAAFAAAAGGAVVIVGVLITAGEASLGNGTWSSLVMAVGEQALAVGIILGLLVLFRERLNRQGPRLKFLSANAYTVYVIHPVVLVALGYALSGVQAPGVAKFALLAVLALPLCWAVAYLVRALPGARKVL